jgi:adenosine deaminase
MDDLLLFGWEDLPPGEYSHANGRTANPPYSYFLYHLYANLKVTALYSSPCSPRGDHLTVIMVMTSLISATATLKVLNALREERGFNTLPLKPHAGEAGSRHHMATAFLLADSVNHGIKLQENPALEYLFYLAQIGLAVCPVSNRAPRFPE